MTEFMTVQKLADYLGLNKQTIYRLLEQGKIPAIKIGRSWRFDKTVIDGWLRQKTVGIKASILVIDDEPTICSLIKMTLEDQGHRVLTTESPSEGLELVKQQDFDLIFLDLKMPGMDGAEVFRQIGILKPSLPVIIITGYPDSDVMSRALAHGPFGVMNKPFGESDIITAVNSFLGITHRG